MTGPIPYTPEYYEYFEKIKQGIIKINHTKEINERLKKEGKYEILNKPEHYESMHKMNKALSPNGVLY